MSSVGSFGHSWTTPGLINLSLKFGKVDFASEPLLSGIEGIHELPKFNNPPEAKAKEIRDDKRGHSIGRFMPDAHLNDNGRSIGAVCDY
jgi:hypothetical protein